MALLQHNIYNQRRFANTDNCQATGKAIAPLLYTELHAVACSCFTSMTITKATISASRRNLFMPGTQSFDETPTRTNL